MKVRVIVPDPMSAPRGAEWAAEAVVWVLRAWSRAVQALRAPKRPGAAAPLHRRRAA